MRLKWRIKNQAGRYLHFTEDEANTIIYTHNKVMASVFVGTRDYVDGICKGLYYSIGGSFEPEQLIHVSHPG